MTYKQISTAPKDRSFICAVKDPNGDLWSYDVAWYEPSIKQFLTDVHNDECVFMSAEFTHWAEIPEPDSNL